MPWPGAPFPAHRLPRASPSGVANTTALRPQQRRPHRRWLPSLASRTTVNYVKLAHLRRVSPRDPPDYLNPRSAALGSV